MCTSLSYLILHKSGNSISRGFRIRQSFRMEKTFKVIESNHKPHTAKSSTKPCRPHLQKTLSSFGHSSCSRSLLQANNSVHGLCSHTEPVFSLLPTRPCRRRVQSGTCLQVPVSQGAAEVFLQPRDLHSTHRSEGHAPSTMVFSSGSALSFPREKAALPPDATTEVLWPKHAVPGGAPWLVTARWCVWIQ